MTSYVSIIIHCVIIIQLRFHRCYETDGVTQIAATHDLILFIQVIIRHALCINILYITC
jgi:hypothetical protein